MIWLLALLALLFYGARYAFSGIDNGLLYASRRGLTGDDVELPDIHVGEVLQQWCAHLSAAAFGAAIVLATGKPWWALGGFLLAMNGASQAFTPLFQHYIQKGAGGTRETTHWMLPIRIRFFRKVLIDTTLEVPKLWANRRHVQVYVGLILLLIGMGVFGYA